MPEIVGFDVISARLRYPPCHLHGFPRVTRDTFGPADVIHRCGRLAALTPADDELRPGDYGDQSSAEIHLVQLSL